MTGENPEMTPEELQSLQHKKNNVIADLRRRWKSGELTEEQASQLEALGISKHSRMDVVAGVNDLGTTHPDLAAQWHPAKNGGLMPQDVTAGSNRMAWWQCEKGHEWEAQIASRSGGNNKKGNGCPYCAGRKVWPGYNDLATVNPDLATQWHPVKNGNLSPQQVVAGSNKKVWWLCAQGHEWEAMVNHRTRGSGCPYCSGKRILSGFNDLATTHPGLSAQWHPAKNGGLTPRDVMAGSNKKVWWVCNKGHEWEATIASRSDGTGCPYCAGQRLLPGVNDLATVNPDLAAQWHPARNGRLTPRDVMAGSNKRVWWLGRCSHEWEAPVARRNSGSGCPYCIGQKVLPGFNDLASTDPELAFQWHPIRNGSLTPHDVMPNSNKKVWWQCEKGHEWEATIANRSDGTGCPYCSSRKLLSGYNDFATVNPALASQWHPTRNGSLTPHDVMPNCNKKVWWQCEKGHEWEATVNSRSQGHGCSVCYHSTHKKKDDQR